MSQTHFVQHFQNRIQNFLSEAVPFSETDASPLVKAMRYSLLNGGKRIRALLVYATGHSLDIDLDKLDVIAASVELIHAFSLIHDDLPAMDDDELRRGVPTCHIAFDEATAILAGDALHTKAFEMLSCTDKPLFTAKAQLKMIHCLAESIGDKGVVQGQTIDVLATDKVLSLAQLKEMHYLKTGRLIEACVQLAYIASEKQDGNIEQALTTFSQTLGIAFQIKDDILDTTKSTQDLGKTAGKDAAANKPTFVSLLGLDESKQELKALYQTALKALKTDKCLDTGPLQVLADYIVQRQS